MKGIVKEDMHFSLDGYTVYKYQIGNIVEANTETEIATLEALILEGKIEAMPEPKLGKTTKTQE